jgi:hypothetical protein
MAGYSLPCLAPGSLGVETRVERGARSARTPFLWVTGGLPPYSHWTPLVKCTAQGRPCVRFFSGPVGRASACPTSGQILNSRIHPSHARQIPVRQPFEIIGPIQSAEAMAVGGRIQSLQRLIKLYGSGRWRKMKGVAGIRLTDGSIRVAELHWYEAHGLGRFEIKRKRYL